MGKPISCNSVFTARCCVAAFAVVRWLAGCHVRALCRNGWRCCHSCCGMRIGNRTQAFTWYHFQWPWTTLTQILRSRQYSVLNMSVTVQHRHISYSSALEALRNALYKFKTYLLTFISMPIRWITIVRRYARPTHRCNFKWLWTPLSDWAF